MLMMMPMTTMCANDDNLPGIIYRAGTANRCRAAVGYIRYTTRIINTIGQI